MSGWAIACIIDKRPFLYYSILQFGPSGSISLSSLNSVDPFFKVMMFDTEDAAIAVYNIIISKRAVAQPYQWKVVSLGLKETTAA